MPILYYSLFDTLRGQHHTDLDPYGSPLPSQEQTARLRGLPVGFLLPENDGSWLVNIVFGQPSPPASGSQPSPARTDTLWIGCYRHVRWTRGGNYCGAGLGLDRFPADARQLHQLLVSLTALADALRQNIPESISPSWQADQLAPALQRQIKDLIQAASRVNGAAINSRAAPRAGDPVATPLVADIPASAPEYAGRLFDLLTDPGSCQHGKLLLASDPECLGRLRTAVMPPETSQRGQRAALPDPPMRTSYDWEAHRDTAVEDLTPLRRLINARGGKPDSLAKPGSPAVPDAPQTAAGAETPAAPAGAETPAGPAGAETPAGCTATPAALPCGYSPAPPRGFQHTDLPLSHRLVLLLAVLAAFLAGFLAGEHLT